MIRDGREDLSGEQGGEAPGGLLVVDVGNTTVQIGSVAGGKAIDTAVVDTATLEGLDAMIAPIWDGLDAEQPRAAVASCVVPEVLGRVIAIVADVTGQELLVVGKDCALPMPAAVNEPERVGVDRICAAAAAYAELKQACVVTGFGTAIKIDLVSDDGMFMGGCILPGLHLSALALKEHTAALPLVEAADATHPWGRDTREAISNGLLYGAIGAMREIVERYATETGKWLPLVITGGGCELIAKHADFVDHVVPDLTLRGIALAYHLARGRQDD